MRPLWVLLALFCASLVDAVAMPLCKDVPARGKPSCPANESAVCATNVRCLTSQFPAVTYNLCERWICQSASPPAKTTSQTPRQ